MNYFQDQGRACYKRGDYQKAIEFFDRAIGRGPSVQLFDNRAACHEKLKNLKSALEDAKKAIQLHREDPTGYLRAGRILTKMNKETVALEIYTRGLQYVKHVGQGYELLRTAQKEMMHRLSPKSIDPFTLLPRELAEDILTYLSFKQRVNCCMVSQQWANFIRSCPDLWRHLDLSQTRGKKVKNAFISRTINIARHKLTKATLSYLSDFDKAVAALVKHCPLEELTLLRNGLQASNLTMLLKPATRLKRLILSREFAFPPSELRYLVNELSEHLESLEYTFTRSHDGAPLPDLRLAEVSCPKLRTLTLEYFVHGTRNSEPARCGLPSISERMPALECLKIRNMQVYGHFETVGYIIDAGECTQLRDLDLEIPMHSARTLKLPPTLVRLRLTKTSHRDSSNFWFGPGPAGAQAVTFFLPFLEEVHLEIPGMVLHNAQHLLIGEPREDDEQLANQVGTPSKLRKVTIVGAKLNYRQISELFSHPRLGSLELLHVPSLESCCDDDVNGIMDSLPNLRSLDLSETDITGVGVKRAVESGHLEELIVNNCRKLDVDAVPWARKQGVRVTNRMLDGMNGGSKVRH